MNKMHLLRAGKYLSYLFVICILLSGFTRCTTTSSGKKNSLTNKAYANEGFVNHSLYRIIIIKTLNSQETQAQILKQARNRTLVSFQKYILSENKKLKQNTSANLLNLINENGKIIRIDDKENSRTLYLFEVKSSNLREIILSFGE